MLSHKINSFSIWLLALSLSVVCIILIGGYTRISDSGLSITEWLPISGILYPLSEEAWIVEFNKHTASWAKSLIKVIIRIVIVRGSLTA